MSYSQFIQEKATRIVAEQRVFELFRTREYSTFLVEGDSKAYYVHLWNDCTMECTCPYWTYKHRICSHILASQFYSRLQQSYDSEADGSELIEEELENIVAGVPDIFDPETWR